MKSIWIDGYEANVPQRLGSGQVAFELIRNLEKIDHHNDYTVCIPNQPMEDLPGVRDGFKYKVLKPVKFWTRVALPLELLKAGQKPDVFFSPTHYIPRFTNIKRVSMVFDVAFMRYPKMYKQKDLLQLREGTRYSLIHASSIITISKSSKKDIIKYFGKKNDPKLDPKILEEKIIVSYPGYNNKLYHPIKSPDKTQEILNKYSIKKPYVIYVSTIQPRKNHTRLIEAFKNIENLQLVIVGKTKGEGREGWMFEEILNLPEKLGIKEKIIFTGFVPDDEAVYLLNKSTALVYPSLWEGFGIPVVDAMACGVPVIVSNVSSLPEVVGKSGLLVNPESVVEIEQAIRLVSTDKKVHNKLCKMSLMQVKKFSWQKMAKDVMKVLEVR